MEIIFLMLALFFTWWALSGQITIFITFAQGNEVSRGRANALVAFQLLSILSWGVFYYLTH